MAANKRRSTFNSRQYMLSEDFEVFYYSDIGFKSVGSHSHDYYEIYFFSSNLDHFINNDANVETGKKYLADQFVRSYGLNTEKFSKYFFEDKCSVGHMGYEESWEFIRENSNSVKRYTNIDCLIRSLMSD